MLFSIHNVIVYYCHLSFVLWLLLFIYCIIINLRVFFVVGVVVVVQWFPLDHKLNYSWVWKQLIKVLMVNGPASLSPSHLVEASPSLDFSPFTSWLLKILPKDNHANSSAKWFPSIGSIGEVSAHTRRCRCGRHECQAWQGLQSWQLSPESRWRAYACNLLHWDSIHVRFLPKYYKYWSDPLKNVLLCSLMNVFCTRFGTK